MSDAFEKFLVKKSGVITHHDWARFCPRFLNAFERVHGGLSDIYLEFNLSNLSGDFARTIDYRSEIEKLNADHDILIVPKPWAHGVRYSTLDLKSVRTSQVTPETLQSAIPEKLFSDLAFYVNLEIRPAGTSSSGGNIGSAYLEEPKKSEKIKFEAFWTPQLVEKLRTEFRDPLTQTEKMDYAMTV